MAPPAKRRTQLVMFQKFTTDTTGEFDVKAWVNVSDAWVSVSPDRGKEVLAQGETAAVITYSIRGDYLDLEQVTEKMRMLHNDTFVYNPAPDDTRVYDIVAVLPDVDSKEDIMLKAVIENRPLSQLPS